MADWNCPAECKAHGLHRQIWLLVMPARCVCRSLKKGATPRTAPWNTFVWGLQPTCNFLKKVWRCKVKIRSKIAKTISRHIWMISDYLEFKNDTSLPTMLMLCLSNIIMYMYANFTVHFVIQRIFLQGGGLHFCPGLKIQIF